MIELQPSKDCPELVAEIETGVTREGGSVRVVPRVEVNPGRI